MAQIYLVRHTKVDIPPGICYGATDVPLAATFPEEARKIKKQLENTPFNKVYSSPLKRCTQLADIIAPNTYKTDSRLVELNFGSWEGKHWDDVYQTPYGKEWMDNYLELPCKGGESYSELYNRISKFLQELDKNADVLIITHAGVIKVIQSIVTNTPFKNILATFQDYGNISIVSNKIYS